MPCVCIDAGVIAESLLQCCQDHVGTRKLSGQVNYAQDMHYMHAGSAVNAGKTLLFVDMPLKSCNVFTL